MHFSFFLVGPAAGRLILGVAISHTTTHQSVGLLWTSDQLVAETSTWQHLTPTTNKRACSPRDSNTQSQQESARRPRGLWDRLMSLCLGKICDWCQNMYNINKNRTALRVRPFASGLIAIWPIGTKSAELRTEMDYASEGFYFTSLPVLR